LRRLSRRFEDAIALLIAVFLIAVAFADILFFHRSLYTRDMPRYFEPAFAILRDVIRSGAMPFWNDRFNAGQPFAANPAFGALYPAQWIFAFVNLQAEIAAHYFLAAIGMYFFLRSLGLRASAALFGAISYALGGMMLSLSNLIMALYGAAWYPWLGLAVRRRRFALAALVLGIVLLIGDQASILQAGFLLITFFIWQREWKPAVVVLACGFLVGSAQIIPALDHQLDSGRSQALPYSMVTMWTLPPARILELALPSLFGSFREWTFYWAGKRFYASAPDHMPWVFSFYNGLLVFVLACAGFIRRMPGYKIVGSYVAFSILTATTPILFFLGVRSIRYPEKFFISGIFMLTVFAAMVLDRLPEVRGTAAAISAIVAMAAAGSLALPFARIWHLSGYYADYLAEARSGAMVTVGTATALALLLAVRRLPLGLLALVVIADLGPRIPGLKPTIDASYYDPPPIARGLRGARVYNDADWRLMLLPSGHLPAELHIIRQRNALLPYMPALWGIQTVLAVDITVTDLSPTIEFRRLFWTALLERRAPAIQRLLQAAGTSYVAELRDATDAANPIRLVRLNYPRYYFQNGAGRVVQAIERPNAVDLDVETARNATLFIAVTRHKYWKGILDGMPSPPRPSNIAFQAMEIPPGRHHVALRYRNPLIVIFGLVSILTATALLAAHFVAEHRRRRGDIERLDTA
jgi:hypothetical protein